MNECFLFEKEKVTSLEVVDDSHAAFFGIEKIKSQTLFAPKAQALSANALRAREGGRGGKPNGKRQIFTQPGGETWH